MGKYYLLNRNAPLGFEEVTEEEYLSVVGLPPVKDYAFKVYRGKCPLRTYLKNTESRRRLWWTRRLPAWVHIKSPMRRLSISSREVTQNDGRKGNKTPFAD